MKKVVLLLAGLLLFGCSTHNKMRNVMENNYNVAGVSTRLGQPSRVVPMEGDLKLYVWSNLRQEVRSMPVYTPDSRRHGGFVHNSAGRPMNTFPGGRVVGTVTHSPMPPQTVGCELLVVANKYGNIESWSYEGTDCNSLCPQ